MTVRQLIQKRCPLKSGDAVQVEERGSRTAFEDVHLEITVSD